ncbi:MAG: sulfite oxidase-like oxidoreductase [Candidatus Lokiarchaeota archaeon]|nr:sulfite oxidase-like oxidoreductase [Candidatus Lokiarchaeota archaeon]
MKERLPPGQKKVDRFPVLQAADIPRHLTKNNWSLEIYGEVDAPKTFNYEEFINLPRTKINTDIHCVTTWSLFDTEWEGVLFTDIFKIVKPTDKAKFVVFECEDLGGRFTTSLPIEVLTDENSMLAFKYAGKELENKHGGPVRGLVPKKYFYKSAKWVRKLKFIEKDELGYWERGGYSNTADPWKEERYS